MKRYYIQISAVVMQGYDEAETYDEILALALRYRAEAKEKFGHLGDMFFDIEEVGEVED